MAGAAQSGSAFRERTNWTALLSACNTSGRELLWRHGSGTVTEKTVVRGLFNYFFFPVEYQRNWRHYPDDAVTETWGRRALVTLNLYAQGVGAEGFTEWIKCIASRFLISHRKVLLFLYFFFVFHSSEWKYGIRKNCLARVVLEDSAAVRLPRPARELFFGAR